MTTFNQLTEKIKQYLPPDKIAAIEKAYEFAMKAHEGQLRRSGEPYLEHPLHVALILAELQLDSSTIAAALLHDVAENSGVPIEEIKEKFGGEVGKLVDGTTKLSKFAEQAPGRAVLPVKNAEAREGQAENLRKMLVAMAEDLRVVFIKLADRLHNMRTLAALPPAKRHSIAQETLEIYTPLANRLGIWELKWELEDLSFRYLQPEQYRYVANFVAAKRVQRQEFIAEATEKLQEEFTRAGLRAEISGRPKHLYSIHQKMEKYAALGRDFDDIYDLLALRVIVSTVADCYAALGIIHNLWHPLPDTFDDYIANPKPNGYQSLHTIVRYKGIIPLEIQIRTREMHYLSEYGLASHWRYKEGKAPPDQRFEERIAWLRQLVEWHRDFSGAEEFLESAKTDIFIDQVFVYTPKGEIKDLPKGATPLDFAYRVHTELGHRCIGAKVNGRLVSLTYQLNNGDTVEIITSKEAKGPSRDWLSPHFGYVKTSHAREKIGQWFRKQEKTENVEQGRKVLEKELRHLGVKLSDQEKIAKLFGYDSLEEFYAAIGYGNVTAHQIALKLAAQEEQPKIVAKGPTAGQTPSAIHVMGTKDLLTQLAKCCRPVPGDKIIGYVTRTRGVTIHRQNCYNVTHHSESERLISVEWGLTDSVYPVNVMLEAWDRIGLIRDISSIMAEEKVNIAAVSSTPGNQGTVTVYFTLETNGLAQLSRLLARIEGVRGVSKVDRLGDQTAARPSPQAEIVK